jgi:hypothetical protein
MAILLGQALEKLAEHYRKYGNIPLYVETPEEITGVVDIDIDIAQIRHRGVAVVFETASLHKQLREQSRPPQVTNMHPVPVGDNSETQEIHPHKPADPNVVKQVEESKPRQSGARHRAKKNAS